MRTAVLTLEDGATFPGRVYGRPRSVAGEVVFNTGMVGYTEALTDPSYRGQILVLTYPLVGNYGVPARVRVQPRSRRARWWFPSWPSEYSHAEAQKSLPQWLDEEGIPCIAGVDTRALTKRLRTRGCMLGKIVVGGEDIELSDPNKENLVAAGWQWQPRGLSGQGQDGRSCRLRREGKHHRGAAFARPHGDPRALGP